MKRWYDNWDAITPIFKFSPDVRKVIYTTNAIEVLLELADYLHECGIEKVSEELLPVRYDNMGQDLIVYFPSVSSI